jgi:hypothetical protein
MRTLILALVAALTLLVAPASAEEPVLYGACTNTADVDAVITPAQGFKGTVTTPQVPLLTYTKADAGRYLLDLQGLPEGTIADVSFMLEWDTPAGLGDYDIVINGANPEIASDTPEVQDSLEQAHCAVFNLETTAFSGTPADKLTLTISATQL